MPDDSNAGINEFIRGRGAPPPDPDAELHDRVEQFGRERHRLRLSGREAVRLLGGRERVATMTDAQLDAALLGAQRTYPVLFETPHPTGSFDGSAGRNEHPTPPDFNQIIRSSSAHARYGAKEWPPE